MDTTQLRGISRTAPYFHNNSAATLEEVLDHYEAFFRSVVRTSPPTNLPAIISSNGTVVDRGFIAPEEREALLAYLRRLSRGTCRRRCPVARQRRQPSRR